MHWYAFLLYPFALLYDLVTSLRNFLFETGVFKMKKSLIPSIVVGNLSIGGTGKTPTIEFLIRRLSSIQKIATLSRGYGRKTQGFLKASASFGPNEIGDEPFQLFEKFGSVLSVFVGEDRVGAAAKIAALEPDVRLLLLDDAFQHRYFKADLAVVLTTYANPFTSDYLLPMGRLREARKGAARADIILVTKTPVDLGLKEKEVVVKRMRRYAGADKAVLFSSISYGQPYPLNPKFTLKNRVILFSGLANDDALREHVSSNFLLEDSFNFPDHHVYSAKDFKDLGDALAKYSAQDIVLLTTEKDAGKVKSSAPAGFLTEIPIFVLPIEVVMADDDLATLEKLIQLKVLNKGRTQ